MYIYIYFFTFQEQIKIHYKKIPQYDQTHTHTHKCMYIHLLMLLLYLFPDLCRPQEFGPRSSAFWRQWWHLRRRLVDILFLMLSMLCELSHYNAQVVSVKHALLWSYFYICFISLAPISICQLYIYFCWMHIIGHKLVYPCLAIYLFAC